MPLAAAFLGLSPRTFEKLWRGHKLPQPHRLGRRLLWDIKILENYIDVLSRLNVEMALEEVPNEDW